MRMVSMAGYLTVAVWLTLTMIGVKYANAYLNEKVSHCVKEASWSGTLTLASPWT
jgi:hypothetical protein